MNTANIANANNQSAIPGIDISRLRRRPVDIKSVSAPRFLFPGWMPVTTNQLRYNVITESEWNSITSPILKQIRLDRGREFSLSISWNTDNEKEHVWEIVSARGVFARTWSRHVIWYGANATFEQVVKAAENFLLRAHDRYSYDVFHDAGEGYDHHAFRRRVDGLMATWKQSQAF